MSEHLTQNQIVGFGRRTLAAAELLSASDHLSDCEGCRRQVERALDGDAAFFALKSDLFGEADANGLPIARTHLTIEQTADYVDGILAREELLTVKDHLTSCDQCLTAVNDLSGFKDQVAPELDREYRPADVRTEPENFWDRFVKAISFLPRPQALVLGSALTALLVIAAGWLIWRTMGQEERKPSVAQTPSQPAPNLPQVNPPAPPPEETEETMIAQLNDGGGQIILDRDGNLSGVESLPPSYRQLIKRTLTDQQLEKPSSLEGLTGPGSLIIRGGNDQSGKFSVLEPIGKVMLSDMPTFRWSQLEGAASYVVEIYDDKAALAASSPRLTEQSWTAPQSLKRGAAYSWQVTAVKDGEEFVTPRAPSPQAKFFILDQVKAKELAQARRAYASSHLALALLYAQAGLLEEAERELRSLQKANPNSAIVRRLLTNVRALRS